MIDSLSKLFPGAVRAPRAGEVTPHGIPPLTVLEPDTGENAAAMLAHCSAEGLRVLPVGARTWLNTGDAPGAPYAMISTARLTTIAQYEPEDLTITAGAGVTFDELQRVTGRNKQWLAQDPPRLEASTLGGWVATASAGPVRARYGTPRDHVLGLEIATGDGRLMRLGGRVVKNVAGYDLTRLVVGSAGGLGIITEVSIRLRPVHRAQATLAFAVSPDEMTAAAEAVSRAWPVAALELITPWLGTSLIGSAAAHPDWTMLVLLHGHPDEVSEGAGLIERMLLHQRIPADSFDAPGVWETLRMSEATGESCVRLAARPVALDATIDIAKSLSDLVFAGTPSTAAHAADGIVRVWGTPDRRSVPDVVEAVEAARQKMNALNGSLKLVSGFGKTVIRDARKAEINAAVSRAFDPAGILPLWRV